MFKAKKHRYLVTDKNDFRVATASTKPPEDAPDKKQSRKRLKAAVDEFSELQRVLYAHDRYAVLLLFQAMDAAGKDSTIRTVLSGVNPAGCQVFSFKKPSHKELDHDFLWRTVKALPERGRIGVFNRSYYEEVLVVRVHPGILDSQKLPGIPDSENVWEQRFESIRDHEKHLARNGTVILKFWLNVSLDEQRSRFLSRLDEPQKNWKFEPGDVKERQHWDAYMDAYEQALNETARPWAPWYAIPADDKPFMRLTVAEIIVKNLKSLGLEYPRVDGKTRAVFKEMRKLL